MGGSASDPIVATNEYLDQLDTPIEELEPPATESSLAGPIYLRLSYTMKMQHVKSIPAAKRVNFADLLTSLNVRIELVEQMATPMGWVKKRKLLGRGAYRGGMRCG